ncbi:MAG: hypothetical protein JWO94_628 [Verrucomicrobiaceae bacterium]|nr:hypothetical protein [Verrucomicrobiaceae bacterium]
MGGVVPALLKLRLLASYLDMRFFIVIAALLMIPAFAVVMEWRFQHGQRQGLEAAARERLVQAGLEQVVLTLDHFDAVLSGACSDPAGRDRAQALVAGVRGIRVKPEDNQIRVPAKLSAGIQARELSLTGWLPSEKQRSEIVRLVKAWRPEMEVTEQGVRISSHVDLGPAAGGPEGNLPKVFSTLLESIRLPASLNISGDGHRYIFNGSLPSEALREAVIHAAHESAPSLEIDASGLIAHAHVASAPFAEGPALADFVRAYFESPSPGAFQIDQRNGPRLQAYATAAMESAWLTALRAVAGGTHVTADITLLPSIYHFPAYEPETKLERPVIDKLREIFRASMVFFDSGSSRIKPAEEATLAVLAETIKNAGPGLYLIVAGYADVGGEPGTTGRALQRTRAENLRTKLIELGVAPETLEPMPFDAVRPPGPLTDQTRHGTRSAELLIK